MCIHHEDIGILRPVGIFIQAAHKRNLGPIRRHDRAGFIVIPLRNRLQLFSGDIKQVNVITLVAGKITLHVLLEVIPVDYNRLRRFRRRGRAAGFRLL